MWWNFRLSRLMLNTANARAVRWAAIALPNGRSTLSPLVLVVVLSLLAGITNLPVRLKNKPIKGRLPAICCGAQSNPSCCRGGLKKYHWFSFWQCTMVSLGC